MAPTAPDDAVTFGSQSSFNDKRDALAASAKATAKLVARDGDKPWSLNNMGAVIAVCIA